MYCFNYYEIASHYGGKRFDIYSLIDIFNMQLINFFLRLKIIHCYTRMSLLKN